MLQSMRKHKAPYSLPTFAIELEQQPINTEHLHRYQRVCGFTQSNQLPMTYPHILAFPLHMKLLVDKSFPFPVIGLVHIRNMITQYRSLSTSDRLNLHCQFTALRHVDKGLEFDIATYVSTAGECVWESVSTFLYRDQHKNDIQQKHSASRLPPLNPYVLNDHDYLGKIKTALNTGRVYGKISHDINPIHLFTSTAKLFGFKTAIAHGMWSKAQVIATCDQHLPELPFTIEVNFKKPLMLPNTAHIHYLATEQHAKITLTSPDNEHLHLEASVYKI